MAVENSPISGVAENDDVRRKALLRLGVAGVVTAAALAGLWWLDQGGGRKPEPAAPSALPSPIVSAPMQQSAPPQTAPDVDPEVTTDSPEDGPAAETPGETTPTAAAPTPAPAGTASTRDTPPPPRVSNAPMRTAQATAPASIPAPAVASRAPQPPHAATALGEPYLVQLGVFSEPARARELVDRLKKQGIRAHLETRVHLGPFANREEAEKAQAEIRRLGLKGVLTPATTQ
ncbi:MAG: SPOR domain-containing protein [Pseudomonadota bacterium]|nr:SPOR domain-containing protein [Pseudomonadota bacterium]MDP1902996.1 SPOR domain-containing protein [Pseudomonadota bacterium]MDP2352232.1 SPOR domain-containing protein [Pseudomonadota bacterium]